MDNVLCYFLPFQEGFSISIKQSRNCVFQVSKDVEVLDLMSRASPIVADGGRANVNPRAVEAVLERLRVIEVILSTNFNRNKLVGIWELINMQMSLAGFAFTG